MNWRKAEEILPEDKQRVVYDVGLNYEREPKAYYNGYYNKAEKEFCCGTNHDLTVYDQKVVTWWMPLEEYEKEPKI